MCVLFQMCLPMSVHDIPEEEEEYADEDDDQEEIIYISSDMLDEINEEDISPEGTIKIVTCDKETNTETEYRLHRRRPEASIRGSAIRRSQTFSPAGRPGMDYICKVCTATDLNYSIMGGKYPLIYRYVLKYKQKCVKIQEQETRFEILCIKVTGKNNIESILLLQKCVVRLLRRVLCIAAEPQ